MKLNSALILLVFAGAFFACHSSQTKDVKIDTSINALTSFNNLFLDSIQLRKFIDEHREYKNYEKQFIDFYKERNYEYAWFDSSGIGDQAKGFINLLNSTISDLQDSSLYNPRLITLYNIFAGNDDRKRHKGEVLNTELLLTGQFFQYASKMYKGTDSNIADLGWFIPRKKINFTALLDSVIVTKSKKVDEFASLNEQYIKLRNFLLLISITEIG